MLPVVITVTEIKESHYFLAMKGRLERRQWSLDLHGIEEEKKKKSVAGCFLYEEELYRPANQTNLTDTNKLNFMAQ